MSEVTQILGAIERGEPQAAELLLPLVYEELRKLAAQRLAHEKPGQTLQATALVHEAYLRLVDDSNSQRWENRGHFFGAAAESMRRILVDLARRRLAEKHGGGRPKSLILENVAVPEISEELLILDEAMQKLAATDGQVAELVKLRYFAGLTNREAADCLGISPRTADNHWAYAKAWLLQEIEGNT